MALFNPKKLGEKPVKPPGSKRSGFFIRRGGRAYPKYFDRKVDQMGRSLTPPQKEYVKAVMRKHHKPGSLGVTEKEFEKGLEEMEENRRDSIKPGHVRSIKKHFWKFWCRRYFCSNNLCSVSIY